MVHKIFMHFLAIYKKGEIKRLLQSGFQASRDLQNDQGIWKTSQQDSEAGSPSHLSAPRSSIPALPLGSKVTTINSLIPHWSGSAISLAYSPGQCKAFFVKNEKLVRFLSLPQFSNAPLNLLPVPRLKNKDMNQHVYFLIVPWYTCGVLVNCGYMYMCVCSVPHTAILYSLWDRRDVR